jgi:iron complex outermembrane receptor protein
MGNTIVNIKSKCVGVIAAGLLAIPIADLSAQESSGSSSNAGPIEEIIVTSRKREESLSDVPIYVKAMTEVQLVNAGIENAEDFIGKLPSISKSADFLSPGKEFMMMVIRGVGANGGMEPAAPVFIDGVYVPRLGFDANFMDVERVEVLYGPQSTLFGRNAEAGAISIITKRPSEEFRSRVSLEWDEFDTYKAKGAVSGQISEKWFAGIAVEGMTTNGYLDNIGATNVNTFEESNNPGAFFAANLDSATDPDSAQSTGARASLRWLATEKLEVNLTLDTYSFKGGVGLPGVPADCDCYDLDLDLVLDSEHESDGASLFLDYVMDSFDITSITAYRELSSKSPFDFDGSSYTGLPPGVDPAVLDTNIPGVTNTRLGNIQDYRFDQEIISQEVRLTSNSDSKLQWLVGAYYFDESFFSDRNIDIMGANVFPFFTRTQDVDADREGWAVFGQTTYDITDAVQLSVGLRYSDEEATALNVISWESPVFPDFLNQNLGGPPHTQEFTDDNVDYSVSLRWNMSDEITAFLTTATAFKSGGFQLAITGDPTADAPYLSETITSYELGFKGTFLDNRLRANLSFFNLELEDQQVRTIRTFNGLPFTVTTNAAEATSKGINFDILYYPTENWKLSAAIGYTNAEFDEFVIPSDNLDFSGTPLRFVPEVTANIGAEWTLPIQGKALDDITLYANWRYVDEQLQGYEGVSVDIQFEIEAYDLLDVGARFNINENTMATIYVDNVTDEYVQSRYWNVFLFTNPGGVPRVMSTVLPPRHVGVRVTHQF